MNEIEQKYYYKDKNLLMLKVLLENYKNKRSIFTLEDLLKNISWRNQDILEEVLDEHDEFGRPEDLVLFQVIEMLQDLKIAEVTRVSLSRDFDMIEEMIKDAILSKDDSDENVSYYGAIVRKIYELDQLRDKKLQSLVDKGAEVTQELLSRIDLEPHEVHRLELLSSRIAPSIELELKFNADEITKSIRKISDLLKDFENDTLLSEWIVQRSYFSQQISNFYNYIKDFPIIKSSINIPTSAINRDDFDIVKIMLYLEDKKIIVVQDWSASDVWNIKLSNKLKGVQDLIPDALEPVQEARLKPNLSFDTNKSFLLLGEKRVRIQKGSDQYVLLQIIFQEEKYTGKEWFFSEVSERLDPAASFKDKKFYNAAYQLKQKIGRDTGLNDVLITTKHSIQINPKYLGNN